MALTANTLTLSSGTIDISIYSTEFTVSDTFEVLDFGAIEYIHDVPDGVETDASVVRSILGTLKIQAYDVMDGGNSLYNQLLLIPPSTITDNSAFVVVDYIDKNSVSKPFYFSITFGDFSITSRTKKVDISFKNVPKDLFTSTDYPKISDTVTNNTAGASNVSIVDGAASGLTFDVRNVTVVPSDGDVIYFSTSESEQAYVVDSATSTTITLKYELKHTISDGTTIFTRNPSATTASYMPRFFIEGSSSDWAYSAIKFIKIALEDLLSPSVFTNGLYEVYKSEVVILSSDRSFESGEILQAVQSGTGNVDMFVRHDDNLSNISARTYQLLSRIAAISGSFFGFGFGKLWFVPRISTTDVVTLSLDDVLSLEFEIPNRNFQFISEQTLVNSVGAGFNYTPYNKTKEFDAYISNQKEFKYTGRANNAIIAVRDAINSISTSSTYSTEQNNLSEDWVDEGLASYIAAKGHPIPSGLRVPNTFNSSLFIEFEAYNVNSILPYQPIQFDTSVESEFQGNIYRPFELSYNFVKNTVSGKAYKIG